jgi:hypothetical protein
VKARVIPPAASFGEPRARFHFLMLACDMPPVAPHQIERYGPFAIVRVKAESEKEARAFLQQFETSSTSDVDPGIVSLAKPYRSAELLRKWTPIAAVWYARQTHPIDLTLWILAIDRLAHGDVWEHREGGVGVRCRTDLGDGRISAKNYWPEKQCLCRAMKQSGYCSHLLAARIYRFAEQHPELVEREYGISAGPLAPSEVR